MNKLSHAEGRVIGTAPIAVGLGFALLALAIGMKGFNQQVQVWGRFHWLITYDDGFIRRGLIGSLFQYFHGDSKWAEQADYIVQINVFCVFGIVIGLAFWLMSRLAAHRDISHALGLATIAALFATSQFLPTVSVTTGYLDSLLYLLFVCAAVLACRGRYLAAALLGATGPFIHESFIFIWPPIALFALWSRGPLPARLLCALAPVLGTFAVIFFHDKEAALAQVTALPMSDAYKQALLKAQLGQSASSAFKTMVDIHLRHWPRQIWSFLFFCAPAILMIVTYVLMRLGQTDLKRRGLFLSVCFLSPLAALVFGWDLSRFLVIANLTTFVGILMIDGVPDPIEKRRLWPLAMALPVVVLGFFSPLIYAYFESAKDATRGFLPVQDTALYQAIASFADQRLNLPSGSYRGSCRRMSVKDGILTAHCKDGSGGVVVNTFILSECKGDISNINGRLTCTAKAD